MTKLIREEHLIKVILMTPAMSLDMVMVFNIGQMVLITRVNGTLTKLKGKEPSGMPRETFIMENSEMIWPMDMENILI